MQQLVAAGSMRGRSVLDNIRQLRYILSTQQGNRATMRRDASRKAPKTLTHGCKRSNQDECAIIHAGGLARAAARSAARRPYAQPGHCRNGIGMNTGDLSQSDNPRLAYTDGPSRSKPSPVPRSWYLESTEIHYEFRIIGDSRIDRRFTF